MKHRTIQSLLNYWDFRLSELVYESAPQFLIEAVRKRCFAWAVVALRTNCLSADEIPTFEEITKLIDEAADQSKPS